MVPLDKVCHMKVVPDTHICPSKTKQVAKCYGCAIAQTIAPSAFLLSTLSSFFFFSTLQLFVFLLSWFGVRCSRGRKQEFCSHEPVFSSNKRSKSYTGHNTKFFRPLILCKSKSIYTRELCTNSVEYLFQSLRICFSLQSYSRKSVLAQF